MLSELQQTDLVSLILCSNSLWLHGISLSCCTKYCYAKSYRTIKIIFKDWFRNTSYNCFLSNHRIWLSRLLGDRTWARTRFVLSCLVVTFLLLLLCCKTDHRWCYFVKATVSWPSGLPLSRHYWGITLPNGKTIASTATMCLRSKFFFCHELNISLLKFPVLTVSSNTIVKWCFIKPSLASISWYHNSWPRLDATYFQKCIEYLFSDCNSLNDGRSNCAVLGKIIQVLLVIDRN